VDRQVLQRDLEDPWPEAEPRELHAPARQVLQAGDNAVLQPMLEPTAAQDDEDRKRQSQQAFQDVERDAQRFGNFPARRQPAIESFSPDFSPHDALFPAAGRAGLQPRRNREFPASTRLAPRATLSDKLRGARDEETITSVV